MTTEGMSLPGSAREPEREEQRVSARRWQPGRRKEDVTSPELIELVRTLTRMVEAEAQDRKEADKRIEKALADEKEERKDLELRQRKLTSRVLVAAGVFATLVYLSGWIGPTVVREAIRGLFSGP